MERAVSFICWAVAIIGAWALSHTILSKILVHFPDPNGGYMRLTATTYAMQIAASVILIILFIWQLSGIYLHAKGSVIFWVNVKQRVGVLFTIGIILLTLQVLQNRSLWFRRLWTGDAGYDYLTPFPASSSVIMTLAVLFITFMLSYNRRVGYKRVFFIIPVALTAIIGALTFFNWTP